MSNNATFELDCKPIVDFCKGVDKVIGKDGWIYISLIGGVVRLHFYNSTSFIDYSTSVDSSDSLMIGVDAKKFSSVFKNLYEDKAQFKLAGSKFIINQHNIKVKLSVLDYHDFDSPKPDWILESDTKDWIVDSVSKCNFLSSSKVLADGVLIDFGKYLRVCKMTYSIIRILTHPPFTIKWLN